MCSRLLAAGSITAGRFQILMSISAPGGGSYFTAPIERPRTSCFCAIQPITTIGNTAMVQDAASFAQNSPSAVTKRTMNIGTVDSLGAKLNARKNSFQAKMIDMNMVATRPGATIGSTI